MDALRAWTTASLLNFTLYFFDKRFHRRFIVGQHHIKICRAFDRVLRGDCTRLIINMPPRYGKTELLKNFASLGFAVNPSANFIHLSYSDDLVRDNSKCIQDIMREPDYSALFPSAVPVSSNTRKWQTRGGGGFYAVSSAGQVTGFGAGLVDEEDDSDDALVSAVDALDRKTDSIFGGAIIIDDPIKPDDARSETIREKVNQKFETTIRNRVNSRKTPIIIIMQRLDEDDLCGYLAKLEPDEWEVVSMPAIVTDADGQQAALWPFKHTLAELYSLRDKNAFVFDTQYLQNPQPLEGLMYERQWRTYEILPYYSDSQIQCYCDTADEGTDYLCAIIYIATPTGNFILDVLYTQKPMEYTEQALARLLCKYRVEEALIESNNGGRGFARNVRDIILRMGNKRTYIKWFYQSDNKQSRIFTRSAEVQNMTVFPENWELAWPEFARAIKNYRRIGGNQHDDAPDALTGTVEFREREGGGDAASYFS